MAILKFEPKFQENKDFENHFEKYSPKSQFLLNLYDFLPQNSLNMYLSVKSFFEISQKLRIFYYTGLKNTFWL